MLSQRRFERDAALVMGGMMIANASTYLYHVILSRHLGPSSYGALGAVLGIAVLPGVPSSGLQFAVARRVATSDEETSRGVVAGVTRATLGVGLAGVALMLAAAWPLAAFLHTSMTSTAWLATWILPIVLGPVLLGALQGDRLFGWLAASAAVLGAARVVGALLVTITGAGVSAGVAVMSLAAFASAAVAWIVVRPGLAASREHTAGLLSEIVRTTFPFLGIAVLAGIDVILARRFLAPKEAGFYAAASIAGKVVYWAPASLSVVGFAEFARDPTDDHLRRTLIGVGGISALTVSAVLFFRDRLIGTIFGAAYRPAANVVLLIAVAMAFLAILQVLLTWAVARQLPLVGSTILAGAALLALLITVRHASGLAVATDVLVSSLVVTAVMTVRVRRAFLAAVRTRL